MGLMRGSLLPEDAALPAAAGLLGEEAAALLEVAVEALGAEFSPTHPWGCHRRRVPDGSCSTA